MCISRRKIHNHIPVPAFSGHSDTAKVSKEEGGETMGRKGIRNRKAPHYVLLAWGWGADSPHKIQFSKTWFRLTIFTCPKYVLNATLLLETQHPIMCLVHSMHSKIFAEW